MVIARLHLDFVSRPARVAFLLVGAGLVSPALAQEATPAAFSLASSHVATTKETASIQLTFQQVTALDFRVYRVADPFRFFAGLRDPHQLGSPEPVVPEERTWLERIAAWKADRRAELRLIGRRQLSQRYRAAVRERQAREEVVQRRTLRYNTFAQVPLLNAQQVVASWREVLPPVRDAEARRIPLDLPGPGVYLVEAVSPPHKAYTIVMMSDVGLVAKTAPGQVVLYVANRFSGDPIADCTVQAFLDQKKVGEGTTSADGVLSLALEKAEGDALVTLAQCGAQVAASDPGAWYLREASRELRGYVYTDKPIYRPGHTVRAKAILRWRTPGGLVPFDRSQVELVVSDNAEKVIFRANRQVDPFGSISAEFPVPASAALGYYTIQINSGDDTADGSFEVQEYRKPEFEVSVTPEQRFVVQGREARMTIAARYYFGQPVAGGSVQYVVMRAPYYSPLRWTDEGEGYGYDGYDGEQESEETARLDAQGNATITVPTSEDEDGRDYTLRVVARVSDASGREVSARGTVHATVGPYLLAVSSGQYVARPGADATVTIRAVDYAGGARPGVPVTVRLEQIEYNPDDYSKPKVTELAKGEVTTDAQGRATWTTPLPRTGGTYRFRAAASADGRHIEGEDSVWVPGPSESADDLEFDRVLELIADKRTYAPGDTARFIVKGEDFKTAVLVTKERQDVSWHEVVRTSNDDVIEVPVTEHDVGDTYVNIAFLKDDRLFRAEKRVSVPPVSRQVQLTIEPNQRVFRPNEQGVFTIKAAGADGQPVRAQLSVAIIDEAVFGVKADETPDPVRYFYRLAYSRVSTQFSRDYSFVGYSGTQQLLLARRRRPFTLADFKADRPARPEVRKEFPDAIYWVADLETNEAGVATVTVDYPDSLTTWRLTARAVTVDTRLGSGVSRTSTTKDLILRLTPPRFLTEGDQVTVPTIVHNYLPATKDVSVTLEASGVTPLPGSPAGAQSVQVASNGERRIDRGFRADRAGTATFTGRAEAGADRDGVEWSLPVLPYGLARETSATGSVTESGEHTAQLTIPAESNASARTIEVALAPSLAGSMLGALDFLTSFPYGCTEQTLSSFLPNVVVLRALHDLKLAPTERIGGLDRQIAAGLNRLYDYQHEDGGWGWWKTDENHPFMTAYAVYGLIELKARGYRLEEERIFTGARSIAAQYVEHPRAVPDLKAYLFYVLTRALQHGVDLASLESSSEYRHESALSELWDARGRMSPYGRALLLLALQAAQAPQAPRIDTLAAEVLADVKTRGDLAWWETASDPLLEDFTDTSVEATSLTIQALAARNPNEPVLERAVRWLILNRNAGAHWSSTKQTAIVLYGLLAYLQARNERPAAFTADVFVNGEPAGSHAFTPADWTKPDPILVRAAARAGDNDVRIVKRGGGVLYWSATARYYYTGRAMTPTGSRQLALTRQYFALTPVTARNGRRVYREQPFSGTARPGDVVLVRVTMAGSTEWKYLMLEDPIPAGTEALTSMDEYPLERGGRSWDWSQREYRDNRVVVFQQEFDSGRHELTYLLKAVTPGTFKAMPAQVAPMYVPGVSASTGEQPFTVSAAAGDPTVAPGAKSAPAGVEPQAPRPGGRP